MASRAADVFLLLPFGVEQVLTGANSKGVAHDVHRRIGLDRRLSEPSDRVDQHGAIEGELLVLERLEKPVAVAIGPARILFFLKHRPPATFFPFPPLGAGAA